MCLTVSLGVLSTCLLTPGHFCWTLPIKLIQVVCYYHHISFENITYLLSWGVNVHNTWKYIKSTYWWQEGWGCCLDSLGMTLPFLRSVFIRLIMERDKIMYDYLICNYDFWLDLKISPGIIVHCITVYKPDKHWKTNWELRYR